MTELEKMRHAHNYILSLANGIDPVTSEELPNDTCLNNVNLSRCFFYVADVLKQVIDNGGNVGSYKGGEFILTDDFRARLSVNANSVQITEFAKPINELAVEVGMKKIPVTAFTNWLVEKGFLAEHVYNGSKRKEPTQDGEKLGITAEERTNQYGTYKAVLYSQNVQQFLLDNLDEIVERWKK